MAYDADELIGESAVFLQTLDDVDAVAKLHKPVLLVGERGTGKELLASRLHYRSPRWDSVFLQMNCAAISDDLLESELFGHEAGAFTGAAKRHVGRFERAHTGTLFLDEVATTATRVQEKILRLIEYGQFERLGGNETLVADVRIVAATNQDLIALAETNRFRIDLLDRLAFDVITIPPLRERTDDIPLLAEFFAINMATELEREFFHGFTDEAMRELFDHSWPGNVRELKNVVERAVYRNDENEPISQIVLDPFESPFRPQEPVAASVTGNLVSTDLIPRFPVDLRDEIEQIEIRWINNALEANRYNQRSAAEALGLSYHQFRHYLRKYELGSEKKDNREDGVEEQAAS
ncbi:MAG: phage shock protein operon transcriptional activator [Gammaproteobacteria bacterium]|nr:phage shock protein operon transcriptional activator [Gammaproteobacteria bacterium]